MVAATTSKRIAGSDELPAIAQLKPEARLKRLKGLDELAGEQARNRGGDVHRMAEARLYGVELQLPDDAPGAAYQPIVAKMMAELAPEMVAAEFVAINRTLNLSGYGGTGDAVLKIDGGLWIVDWKSRGEDSDHAAYGGEGAQVAAYHGAEYWIVDDGQGGAKRIRPLELAGGLIVSIKPDSYEVFPVDLAKAFDHWAATHAWWIAQQSAGRSIGRKWAPGRTRGAGGTTPAPLTQQLAAQRMAVDKARPLSSVARPPQHSPEPPPVQPKATEIPPVADEDDWPADEGDINVARARYEMGMTPPQREWTGARVKEAIAAGVDFRVSQKQTQRRADLYCALTEWVTGPHWDADDDATWRAVLHHATDDASVLWPLMSVGEILGRLDMTQARQLRQSVADITKGE
jgi:hypothetical protein